MGCGWCSFRYLFPQAQSRGIFGSDPWIHSGRGQAPWWSFAGGPLLGASLFSLIPAPCPSVPFLPSCFLSELPFQTGMMAVIQGVRQAAGAYAQRIISSHGL